MLAASTTNAAGVALLVGMVIVFVAIWAVALTYFILSLVDIIRRPDWQWHAAGQEKVLWLLLVLLVNFLAIPSLIYWYSIRPQLIAVEKLGPPTPPGWYPDPSGMPCQRWYDGRAWTAHTYPQVISQ